MNEPAWINLVNEHSDAPWLATSTTVALTVLATPDGDQVSTWKLSDRELRSAAVDGADVEVSISWKDAQAIAAGTMSPPVAYMQGKLKPAGEMKAVLSLLDDAASPEFASWLGALRP